MNSHVNTILEDARPIEAIHFFDPEGSCYRREAGYIIEAYGEPGMACDLAFFRVLKDGVVMTRVPAWQVQVVYVE